MAMISRERNEISGEESNIFPTAPTHAIVIGDVGRQIEQARAEQIPSQSNSSSVTVVSEAEHDITRSGTAEDISSETTSPLDLSVLDITQEYSGFYPSLLNVTGGNVNTPVARRTNEEMLEHEDRQSEQVSAEQPLSQSNSSINSVSGIEFDGSYGGTSEQARSTTTGNVNSSVLEFRPESPNLLPPFPTVEECTNSTEVQLTGTQPATDDKRKLKSSELDSRAADAEVNDAAQLQIRSATSTTNLQEQESVDSRSWSRLFSNRLASFRRRLGQVLGTCSPTSNVLSQVSSPPITLATPVIPTAVSLPLEEPARTLGLDPTKEFSVAEMVTYFSKVVEQKLLRQPNLDNLHGRDVIIDIAKNILTFILENRDEHIKNSTLRQVFERALQEKLTVSGLREQLNRLYPEDDHSECFKTFESVEGQLLINDIEQLLESYDLAEVQVVNQSLSFTEQTKWETAIHDFKSSRRNYDGNTEKRIVEIENSVKSMLNIAIKNCVEQGISIKENIVMEFYGAASDNNILTDDDLNDVLAFIQTI